MFNFLSKTNPEKTISNIAKSAALSNDFLEIEAGIAEMKKM